MNDYDVFLALLRLAAGAVVDVAELSRYVHDLARRTVFTRFGTPLRIPRADGEDVAQEVLCKFLDQAVHIAARMRARTPELFDLDPEGATTEQRTLGNRIVAGYLQVMLANYWLDHFASDETDSLEALPPKAQPFLEPRDPRDIELAQRVLDRCRDRARDDLTREPDRVQFDVTYDQLVGLALGAVSMETLLEEEAEGDASLAGLPPKQARARLQARLYKRHERVRRALLDAADALVAERALSTEEAGIARATVEQLLLRRQISPAGPSSGKGSLR